MSLCNDVSMARIDSPPSTAAPFGALLTAVLSFSLMQTLAVPALPDLQRAFAASTPAVSWVLSAFLLAASVTTGLLGRIGDMFGKRRTLLAALGVAAVGTLISAVASSLGVLLAGRVLQGLGAATIPLALGIVRDTFPRERVPVAVGWISAMFGIGFGVGLVAAGLVVDALGWRWIFWLGLVVTVAGIVAVRAVVPESPTRSPGRVDVVGAALLSAGLVAVLLAVSQGRVWGWSSAPTIVLLVGGVLSLVVFAAAEARTQQPLVDVRLLRMRPILTANLATLVIGFGMFGAFTLVPQLVQAPPFRASVTQAGLFMLPMAVTMLVASPVAGRIGARTGFRLPLVLACVISAAGFVLYAVAHDSAWAVAAAAAVLGVGVGFAFAAIANLVLAAVEPRQSGEAAGINTIMRTVGGAIGAQTAATVVAGTGYTGAFVMSAVAMGLAALVALTYPREAA
jgi:EmrB/QacA subfamily drug resistance transporter